MSIDKEEMMFKYNKLREDYNGLLADYLYETTKTEQLKQEKENLTKYLEDKYKELNDDVFNGAFDGHIPEKFETIGRTKAYEKILEKVKEGKYENIKQ